MSESDEADDYKEEDEDEDQDLDDEADEASDEEGDTRLVATAEAEAKAEALADMELLKSLTAPLTPKMDHLACFVPGWMALAASRGHGVSDDWF